MQPTWQEREGRIEAGAGEAGAGEEAGAEAVGEERPKRNRKLPKTLICMPLNADTTQQAPFAFKVSVFCNSESHVITKFGFSIVRIVINVSKATILLDYKIVQKCPKSSKIVKIVQKCKNYQTL